jgi:hypothetical protein
MREEATKMFCEEIVLDFMEKQMDQIAEGLRGHACDTPLLISASNLGAIEVLCSFINSHPFVNSLPEIHSHLFCTISPRIQDMELLGKLPGEASIPQVGKRKSKCKRQANQWEHCKKAIDSWVSEWTSG